jgi:hypothetical protein
MTRPLARCHARVDKFTDVASPRCSKFHAEAGSVFSLHLRIYARPRPAARRSRPAAPFRRQPTIRPPNGSHPRTSGSDPTTAWGRAQHRSPCSSRTAPGPALTPAGPIDCLDRVTVSARPCHPVNRRGSWPWPLSDSRPPRSRWGGAGQVAGEMGRRPWLNIEPPLAMRPARPYQAR